MTLTFKRDLQVSRWISNQVCRRSISSTVVVRLYADRQTDTHSGPTARPGLLKWSIQRLCKDWFPALDGCIATFATAQSGLDGELVY